MKTICTIYEIQQALGRFEADFEARHGMAFKEAMVLCALSRCEAEATPTRLGECTRLGASHLSKLLRSLEERGSIERRLDPVDKRRMCFSLTPQGTKELHAIELDEVPIPDRLRPLFENHR